MKFENRPEIFDGLIGGCVKPVVNFNDNLVYSVIFVGDFAQLPPVSDKQLHHSLL